MPVEEVVDAVGVPRERRLGRLVEVPSEEFGFVTEEAIEKILSPEALNGGNVVDIFQRREQDFTPSEMLEVRYRLANGEEVAEMVYVDSTVPTGKPRVCVAASAVHAMRKAIAVLTRKVDNLGTTLRSCREHYYKELLHLRHGHVPQHEAYWFTPKAYEDNVTKEMVKEKIGAGDAKLKEALREQERELVSLRMAMRDTELAPTSDLARAKHVLQDMPLDQLFRLLKNQNQEREEAFYDHLEKMLREKRSVEGGERVTFAQHDSEEVATLKAKLALAEARAKEFLQRAYFVENVYRQQGRGAAAEHGQDVASSGTPAAGSRASSPQPARGSEHLTAEQLWREMFHSEDATTDNQGNRRASIESGFSAAAFEMEAISLRVRLSDTQAELLSKTAELLESKRTIAQLRKQLKGGGSQPASPTAKTLSTGLPSSASRKRTTDEAERLPSSLGKREAKKMSRNEKKLERSASDGTTMGCTLSEEGPRAPSFRRNAVKLEAGSTLMSPTEHIGAWRRGTLPDRLDQWQAQRQEVIVVTDVDARPAEGTDVKYESNDSFGWFSDSHAPSKEAPSATHLDGEHLQDDLYTLQEVSEENSRMQSPEASARGTKRPSLQDVAPPSPTPEDDAERQSSPWPPPQERDDGANEGVSGQGMTQTNLRRPSNSPWPSKATPVAPQHERRPSFINPEFSSQGSCGRLDDEYASERQVSQGEDGYWQPRESRETKSKEPPEERADEMEEWPPNQFGSSEADVRLGDLLDRPLDDVSGQGERIGGTPENWGSTEGADAGFDVAISYFDDGKAIAVDAFGRPISRAETSTPSAGNPSPLPTGDPTRPPTGESAEHFRAASPNLQDVYSARSQQPRPSLLNGGRLDVNSLSPVISRSSSFMDATQGSLAWWSRYQSGGAMDASVQTLTSFDNACNRWTSPQVRPHMARALEAGDIGDVVSEAAIARHDLVLWCANFLESVDPNLVRKPAVQELLLRLLEDGRPGTGGRPRRNSHKGMIVTVKSSNVAKMKAYRKTVFEHPALAARGEQNATPRMPPLPQPPLPEEPRRALVVVMPQGAAAAGAPAPPKPPPVPEDEETVELPPVVMSGGGASGGVPGDSTCGSARAPRLPTAAKRYSTARGHTDSFAASHGSGGHAGPAGAPSRASSHSRPGTAMSMLPFADDVASSPPVLSRQCSASEYSVISERSEYQALAGAVADGAAGLAAIAGMRHHGGVVGRHRGSVRPDSGGTTSRKSMLSGGRWRSEVAQGGVSFRNAPTILSTMGAAKAEPTSPGTASPSSARNRSHVDDEDVAIGGKVTPPAFPPGPHTRPRRPASRQTTTGIGAPPESELSVVREASACTSFDEDAPVS